MTSPGRGGVRAVRGLLLASVCALIALAGHVAAGGEATAVGPLVVVGGPLAAAFVVWADRERRFGELLLAAAGSQLPFHVVFTFCAGSTLPSHSASGDAAMVTGHLAASAAIAWLLSRGEASLWALHRALSRLVARRLPGSPVLPWTRRHAGDPERRTGRCGAGLVLASAHGRRGPPRLHAA
jgi:hypothetical protein